MLYYFPHPSAMRNEINIIRMRQRWGSAGYGVYVMLLELLRESEGQQVFYFPEALAYSLHEDDIEMLESVCRDFSLFTFTGDDIMSSPFLAMCQAQAEERAAKAREWGKMGAKARYQGTTKPQPTPSQAAGSPAESPRLAPSHGDKPYTLPIGGGIPDPCINQDTNDNNDTKEKENQPTKSKLVAMEWLGLPGADWLEMCSSPDLMREPEALRILDLPPVAGRNPAILVDWIRQFGLPKKLYGTLQTLSGDWRVDSPVFQAIFAVVKHVRDTKYKPAHPTQYLVSTAIKFYNQV